LHHSLVTKGTGTFLNFFIKSFSKLASISLVKFQGLAIKKNNNVVVFYVLIPASKTRDSRDIQYERGRKERLINTLLTLSVV
jgi:hypothetical protein